MIKLNLGCGTKKIHGYTNIDARCDVFPDVTCELSALNTLYCKNSVDVIYACHVLEHIQRKEVKHTIERWVDILKPGGELRISVPNFEAVVDYYGLTKNINPLQTLLYGGHKYPQDYHYVMFDFNSLEQLLLDCGLMNIEKYDWRLTDHSHIDDYSQAYLPHMDKLNGMLMSLNVKGIKKEGKIKLCQQ